MAGPVNLHELANLPGAGKAFRVLKKAGFIGDDPTQPRWLVTVAAMQPVACQLTVHAATETEALRIAAEQVESEISEGTYLRRQFDPTGDIFDPIATSASEAE